jgi:hypothetical protein
MDEQRFKKELKRLLDKDMKVGKFFEALSIALLVLRRKTADYPKKTEVELKAIANTIYEFSHSVVQTTLSWHGFFITVGVEEEGREAADLVRRVCQLMFIQSKEIEMR